MNLVKGDETCMMRCSWAVLARVLKTQSIQYKHCWTKTKDYRYDKNKYGGGQHFQNDEVVKNFTT